jgi:hypothetical protein
MAQANFGIKSLFKKEWAAKQDFNTLTQSVFAARLIVNIQISNGNLGEAGFFKGIQFLACFAPKRCIKSK